MAELLPKPFRQKALFRFPTFRFPSFFEDFEEEGREFGLEPSGLSLSEDSDQVFVEAQMPGLHSEDIKVTLDGGILWIQGKRKEEEQKKEEEERTFHRRATYSYSYRLSLPQQTDENDPKATYKDGVMRITFRKLPEKKGKIIPVHKG